MMDEHRNRSQGWQHAKTSGHDNEELLDKLLKNNTEVQKRFLKKIKKQDAEIVDCDFGGINETDIACVLGGKTKNKADMMVTLSDGLSVGVSIKKSLSGQVFLITTERFIKGMEAQYGIKIPDDVVRAISLFWGTAKDVQNIIDKYGSEYKQYEKRKHRLTADTLKKYNPTLAQLLINWFRTNIYHIADFCFSRGLALRQTNTASVVWYKNMLGEHNIDDIYHIDELCKESERHKAEIDYGTIGGGTTISLPFGFVQFHQDQMQFHHQYRKVKELF